MGNNKRKKGKGKARETDVFGGFHPMRVGSITLSQATKVSGKAQRLREKKGGGKKKARLTDAKGKAHS